MTRARDTVEPALAKQASGSRGRHVSPLLVFGVLLALVALGFAYLLGRLSRPPLVATAPSSLPREATTPPGDAPIPVGHLPVTPPVTAPALTRAVDEKVAADVPHPMPEQLRAASRIAQAQRDEADREIARARPPAPPPPPTPAYAPVLAPPGRVIQLGAYDRAREAEAAARTFRDRHSDLLAALPKAVLPFRAAGSKRFTYRVQFIAPSQAQAEVICQRLRPLGQKCKVLY